MIAGVSVEAGREAVVLVSKRPLRVLSSAVHHGGFVDARAVVNLHVDKHDPCADPAGMIAAFARRAGALLLTLSVADWSQPLCVDLVERAEAPGGTAAGERGASGTGARSQRSAPTGPPASRAAAADKAAASTISSAPPPPALMAQVTPPPV